MNHERLTIIAKSQDDFKFFLREIFSKSESLFPNGFIDGEYVGQICDFIQNNKMTARVGPRDHLKSTAFYAHFCWKLFCNWDRNIEGHYFSYQERMAAYHVAKIKKAVKSNPFFSEIIDKKITAESVINYSWDNEHFITLVPHGLLEFKRGIHAPLIYVDDPFQDPDNKMVITLIIKINNIFKQQILDMVQDEIHVCGTPQTNQDFFFDNTAMTRFKVLVQPAEKDAKNKIALWPEWMDWEILQMKKREKGPKLYAQEYLCSPTYAEEAFLKRDSLMACVNSKLKNLSHLEKYETENDVIGAFDIGKKSHPAHLTIFEKIDGKKFRQIHDKWMDGWDYVDQLDYISLAIENLGVTEFYYDNTRGEFEGFDEQDKLPDEMSPVVLTHRKEASLATQFDRAVSNKEIEFLNIRRSLEQMLMVTNDLKALTTPEGHGDSFWSTAMIFESEMETDPEITLI